MKTFLFIASVLSLASICSAQVFTYKPRYIVQIIYGHGMKSSPYFEKAAERPTAVCVIDLDKKTISVPGNVFPEPIEKPIEEVIPNKGDNSYILKMKASKDVGQVWSYFKLQLDKEGKVSYLLLTERLTGKRFARDTFFNLFTSDLSNLFFAMKCESGKRHTVPASGKEAAYKEFLAADFIEQEHSVEMRDGYVYWKDGLGKKAIQRTLRISKVEKLEVSGGDGIKISCKDPDQNSYEVFYSYASKAHIYFISIHKMNGNLPVEIVIMK